MRTPSYPSDVADARWALIEPHLPTPPGGGRPVKADLRGVGDAILYRLRAGCQWRPPPNDFPPGPTVWRYADRWRQGGTPDTSHDLPRTEVRAAGTPSHPRTAAGVDGQSVDATSGGEERGRDSAETVAGRKRHLVVASTGVLLAVLVTAADVDGARAAATLSARLGGQPVGKARAMCADSKDRSHDLDDWVRGNAHWKVAVIRRPEGRTGWVQLPTRWTMERTFARLGTCRRLSKDRGKSTSPSESFVEPAMIHRMLNRLEPSGTDAEFQYRQAA